MIGLHVQARETYPLEMYLCVFRDTQLGESLDVSLRIRASSDETCGLMQSHGGQVRRNADFRQGCDDLAETATPARFTRRSLLRAVVFTPHEGTYHRLWDPRQAAAHTVIAGQVLDVSPHIIVLNTAHGERRLALSPATTAWRGSAVPPAA